MLKRETIPVGQTVLVQAQNKQTKHAETRNYSSRANCSIQVAKQTNETKQVAMLCVLWFHRHADSMKTLLKTKTC